MSLESVKTLTFCLYQIASVSCFIVAFLLLVLFIKGLRIGGTQPSNRITAFFFTFNNLLLPLMTLLLLYFTLVASQTVTETPIIGSRFFPSMQANSLIAIVVVILALSFLGFSGGVTESKITIEAYTVILTFATVFMIAQSCLVTYYAKKYDTYHSQNWGKLMMEVDND